MNIKNIVKVMNFHSLLRVDKARKEAEKYFIMEEELRYMIDNIANNRNFLLDKSVHTPDPSKPELDIYVGSDLGFCGGYNYVVNEHALRSKDTDKIFIGKKLWHTAENVVLRVDKEEYTKNPELVDDYIIKAVTKRAYSKINVFYNEYENIASINWTKKQIFPFKFNEVSSDRYSEDFYCETNLDELLSKMIATYIDFELKIVVINSFASENVMRQNSTSESLKKIDEIEEEHHKQAMKEMRESIAQRTVDDFVNLKLRERAVK